MAEFQEMVREFHRLCETQIHKKNTCDKCPIKIATMGTMFQCYRYVLEKPKEAENIIMAWAAEHPEPVYPTWWSWLINEGVIEKGSTYTGAFDQLKTKLIPAYIAEPLGIEPKEG